MTVRRDGSVNGGAGSLPVRVDKAFTVGGDRRSPRLGLEVAVENRSDHALTTRIGIEWNLTVLGGGGNPAAWYEVAGERTAHDGSGAINGVSAVRQGNDHVGVTIDTMVEPAADAWWAPIETISNWRTASKRVYQGSALLLSWPADARPGAAPRVPRRSCREHRPRPCARGGRDEPRPPRRSRPLLSAAARRPVQRHRADRPVGGALR